jgi:hypothetical protein
MDTIPGADTLGFGFDVTKRYHESSTTSQIFKEGKIDARPMTIGTTVYNVPENIATESINRKDSQSHVFSSRQQVQDHFSSKADVKGSGFGFKGHFEASYSHVANTDKSYYYALVEAQDHSYNLKLKVQDDKWLAEGFRDALNALPDTYTPETQADFFTLFGTYGTHYVHQVKLGGSLYYYVAIEKSTTLTTEKIQLNLELEYKGVFGKARTEAEANWDKVEKNWATSRIVRMQTAGGENDLDGIAPGYREWKGESFQKWANSLINKPGLAGFNLRPLSALARGAKAEAMKKAIVDYLKGGVIVRSNREFNNSAATPPFLTACSIEGPKGIVRPAPVPPQDKEVAGLQVALFDVNSGNKIFDRYYWDANIYNAPKLYDDLLKDVNRFDDEGTDYFAALSIAGVSPVHFPTKLADWIKSCGGRLSAWESYIGATGQGGGVACYAFAGKKGGSLHASEEFVVDPGRRIMKLGATSQLFMREQGLRF